MTALLKDIEKGNKVANILYSSFSTTGIQGRTDMPEDIIPQYVPRGSLAHYLFITLTVSIDYQRDAIELWENSRKTYEDPTTQYLFDPQSLHETAPGKIIEDMKKYGLSRKAQKDAYIWRTVGVTFYKKWMGNPENFLTDCQWDAPTILSRLKSDNHLQNERSVPDYPYLRGSKIGPLWVRMLRDNVGASGLKNLNQVPIPVDIHVARATLALGVVRGQVIDRLEVLFDEIRTIWSQSVEGLTAKNKPMIALDLDEALWHLSKYGCSYRDKMTEQCPKASTCELKEYCIPGKVFLYKKKTITMVELDT